MSTAGKDGGLVLFRELMRTGSFETIFKNGLRDFYTYGYFTRSLAGKKGQAMEQHYRLFSLLMGDQWEFGEDPAGSREIVLTTTRSGEYGNPFDQLYQFHTAGDRDPSGMWAILCLNYLFDLNPDILLNPERETPDKDILADAVRSIREENITPRMAKILYNAWRELVNQARAYDQLPEGQNASGPADCRKEQVRNWFSRYAQKECNTRREGSDSGQLKKQSGNTPTIVRINPQMRIWYSMTRNAHNNDATIRKKHAGKMASLGFLGRLEEHPEKIREWLNRQDSIYDKYWNNAGDLPEYWDHLAAVSSSEGSTFGKSGANYWFMSGLTTGRFVQLAEACFHTGDPGHKMIGESGLRPIGDSDPRFGTGHVSGMDAPLESRFRDLFTFFSQYMPLGEVGTMLVKRLGEEKSSEQGNPSERQLFRFRHHYIQSSLYDYNLSDLWFAAENHLICLVTYRRSDKRAERQELIVPLQIRISVMNGREYVLFYHLIERKIMAMRLEFIDKVETWRSVREFCFTRVTVTSDTDGKVTEQADDEQTMYLDRQDLKGQLVIAEQMLDYIWGTEVTDCLVGPDWEKRLTVYEFRIKKGENEAFIADRIRHEGRGMVQEEETEDELIIRVRCFPTREMRRVARSWYKRLLCSTGTGTVAHDFSVSEDVRAMNQVYENGVLGKDLSLDAALLRPHREAGALRKRVFYRIDRKKINPEKGRETGLLEEEKMPHYALFNEFFSRYETGVADALAQCGDVSGNAFYGKNKNIRFDNALSEAVNEEFDYYFRENDGNEACTESGKGDHCNEKNAGEFPESNEEIILQKAVDSLHAEALKAELIDEKGNCRFLMQHKHYLRDLLPLTWLEVRWILTVLENPLAKVFLSADDEQIAAIRDAIIKEASLIFEAKPLAVDKVLYFDRWKTEDDSPAIIHRLSVFCDAMRLGKMVRIVFRTGDGREKTIDSAPVWLEYSGRDDTFRVWHLSEDGNSFHAVNLPRIRSVDLLPDRKYDLSHERVRMAELEQKQERVMTVEFFRGSRNIADRILTEFSLWKKRCVYDTAEEKFTMTLFYSDYEEKEIVIRLLQYGPYIRIVKDTGRVLDDMRDRIRMQADMI